MIIMKFRKLSFAITLASGALILNSCAQQITWNPKTIDPTDKSWVTTSSIEFLLPNEFEQKSILNKDNANWEFSSDKTKLFVEIGSNTSKFSTMREGYEKLTDYKERAVTIDGVSAIYYTLSFTSNVASNENSEEIPPGSQYGLYIPGTDTRHVIRLTLEGDSIHLESLASEIFSSIRFR
jgi:hypothetical protein